MYRILIVEDSPSSAERIESFVRSALTTSVLVERYSSVEEFLCAPFALPDIALLDIELPGESGIALGERLNRYAPNCQIIYLTDHLDYAVDVYSTEHFWFLTKSRMEERLSDILRQALTRAQQSVQHVLLLALKSSQQVLRQNEILYLERTMRTTHIHTQTDCIHTSEPLTALLQRLDPSLFVRCHNSYAVNLQHIRVFHRTYLVLDNGDSVLISRAYQSPLRERFGNYISESVTPSRMLD